MPFTFHITFRAFSKAVIPLFLRAGGIGRICSHIVVSVSLFLSLHHCVLSRPIHLYFLLLAPACPHPPLRSLPPCFHVADPFLHHRLVAPIFVGLATTRPTPTTCAARGSSMPSFFLRPAAFVRCCHCRPVGSHTSLYPPHIPSLLSFFSAGLTRFSTSSFLDGALHSVSFTPLLNLPPDSHFSLIHLRFSSPFLSVVRLHHFHTRRTSLFTAALLLRAHALSLLFPL